MKVLSHEYNDAEVVVIETVNIDAVQAELEDEAYLYCRVKVNDARHNVYTTLPASDLYYEGFENYD